MFDLNLPNVLTLLRILLVPVLVAGLLAGTSEGDLLAAIVFCLASGTDFVDGWLARRRSSITTFGKLMDPLADKLLVTAALVSLVSLHRVDAWVAMVIIAREFAVTGLRLVAMETGGHQIPASLWGKAKTSLQMAMVLVIIAADPATWVDALVYLTVLVTVLSGADYFFGLRRMMAEAGQARPSSHSRMET